MNEYLITRPLVIGNKLAISGDSFFGEKVNDFIYLYNPKTRVKVGYISEVKLLAHSVVDEAKGIVDIPFGTGHTRFFDLSLDQIVVLNYLAENCNKPARRDTLITNKKELIEKLK